MRRITCFWAFLFFVAPSHAQDSPIFDFQSGFWINLHHFLLEQATAGTPPTIAPCWTAAVDYYRATPRDPLSDEAAQINQHLSLLESGDWRDNPTIPPELASVLQTAAPIYRDRWWTDHDHANRAWIEAVKALLSTHGEALKKDLARVYNTPWPGTPIRTDVTEYATRNGAYTTLDPTHITISSTNPSYSGNAALEMLFHEASHSLIGKVSNTLSAEARAQNKLYQSRDFWHAVLFYTAGELVQNRLEAYVPYAEKNGLFPRVWNVQEILDKDWKPYLNGEVDLVTAVRKLLQTYGVSQ